jgi:hypothetical protein
VKVPGTLETLAAAIEKNGWGTPQELRFDSEGHLVGLVLRPPAPGASAPVQTPTIPKRTGVSPLSIHGRPPSDAS